MVKQEKMVEIDKKTFLNQKKYLLKKEEKINLKKEEIIKSKSVISKPINSKKEEKVNLKSVSSKKEEIMTFKPVKKEEKFNLTTVTYKKKKFKKKFKFNKAIAVKLKRALEGKRYIFPKKVEGGFNLIFSIKIRSNNIFCVLKNTISNKTLYSCTSGKYKIKVTKKSLRFNIKPILLLFLKEIRSAIRTSETKSSLKNLKKNLIILLTAPIRIRKTIILFLSNKFCGNTGTFNRDLIFKVNEKKCFNGCRPAKAVRKKRKGFRVFK